MTRSLLLGVLIALAPSLRAQDAPRVVIIGGAEDVGTLLGEARRVLVIGDRILSLHDNAPFLKVFDPSGRMVQSFGRAGAGPGEFRHPATALHDPTTGEILVFDDALGRVSHLAFGDTLSFRRARTISIAARDACFIGRSLFIEAFDGTHFIHEIKEVGAEMRVVRSLGTIPTNDPETNHPVFRGYVADGPLACSAAAGRIALASRDVGLLHLIDATTGAQTTTRIASYARLGFEIVDGTGLRLSMPESGVYDQIEDLQWQGTALRIVLGRADSEFKGAGEYASYRDVLVAADGRQTPQPSRRWRVVSTERGRVTCYRGSPYPTIAVAEAACPAR